MLKPKSPQESFYDSYLYDSIVPADHLLRKINQVVDFSFTSSSSAGQVSSEPRYREHYLKQGIKSQSCLEQRCQIFFFATGLLCCELMYHNLVRGRSKCQILRRL